MYLLRAKLKQWVVLAVALLLTGVVYAWPPVTKGSQVAKDVLARNFYVVLDGSGSMKDRSCTSTFSKNHDSKSALGAFSLSVPKNANLGLAVFDAGGLREVLPLGLNNRDAFMRAVNAVNPGGGTPLRDAVQLGRRQLEAQAARQLGYGEYTLVVVTDGEANVGQDPGSAVNAMLRETPVVLNTIGFCIGAGHSLNQKGRTIYRSANSEQELRNGLAEVLAESPDFAVTRFDRH
jgi:Ca-activated chloride channel homolog